MIDRILMRTFLSVGFFGALLSTLSHAQGPSCIEKVVDMQSLEACGTAELFPLQEKLEALTRELSQRHRDNPNVWPWLSSSKIGWDSYHVNHCAFEAAARTASTNKPARSIEGGRFLLECSKRLLEQRIRELQAL